MHADEPVNSVPADAVRLIVVMPVFRHSVLIAEALDSVLTSRLEQPFAVVVCSDGCPLDETDVVLSSFALSDPRVIYLRKPNAGPSSARNFAIDYGLACFPGAEAVYFLDADNRVTPTALQEGFGALRAAPEAGWVYSHFDTFGVAWNADYGAPYSPLLHIVHENLCDTGSFVRREVFDAGLRFDEDSRSGFEDWDFWLQCIKSGFRGKHVPFGFDYRQRPESRYRESSRKRGMMVERLRERHPALVRLASLLALEQETNPRYLLTTSAGQHFAFTDPIASKASKPADDLSRDLWAYEAASDRVWAPAYFLFATAADFLVLEQHGLIHNVLWLLEQMPAETHFACVSYEASSREIAIDAGICADPAEAAARARIWFCSNRQMFEVLRDREDGWIRSLASRYPGPAVYEIKVKLPERAPRRGVARAAKTALTLMLDAALAWRNSDYGRNSPSRWSWRAQALPPRHTYYSLLCAYIGSSGCAPRVAKGAIDVGFVMSIAAFGGAEKVSYALAQTLRRRGAATTHLFVVGQPKLDLLSEFRDAFDTINFLPDQSFPTWGGPAQIYGESCFLPDAQELQTERMLGFLGTLDVIVNCQSAPLNALIGALKRTKVTTINYLHVFDKTTYGRFSGHPFISLGYEHAYDLIVTCSNQLADQMHALGVPGEKLMAIPNAASFTISDEIRDIARVRRVRPLGGRKLRCLFIGRLDRQKGLERIVATMRLVAAKNLPVEFRMIGSRLVEGDIDFRGLEDEVDVRISPAVHDSDDLTEAYLWADVLLLASRWEGAPLVIPEAQQLGAIPVSTDVGAVSELIEDGVDGLLIEDGADELVAEHMSAVIARLASDAGERRRLAAAGIARSATKSWEQNFAPLVDWLEQRHLAERG